MKKFSIILVLFFLSTNIFGQSEKINQLFTQYQDAQGVTTIKIAKPMFGMLNKLNIGDSELKKIKPLLKKIQGLNIMIMEKPTFPADLAAENVVPLQNYETQRSAILSAISNLKYEELVTVNSRDNKIKFLASDATDGIFNDLLLNITTNDNTILMMLDGKISMDDVSNLIEETKNVTALNPISSINSTTQQNTASVRKVSAFDGIEVSTGVSVKFTQAANHSVVVDVEPDKLQYVITEVENNVLKIFIRNNGVKNLNIRNLIVKVSSPKMNRIVTKSGASFQAMNTIKDRALAIEASSGSRVDGDFDISSSSAIESTSGSTIKMKLQTGSVALDASSGSFVRLNGSADNVAYSVTSGATLDGANFATKKATVSASSGSSVKVNVSDALTASVSSAASVQYKGNPSSIVTDVKKITGASLTQIN
ncbi:DUF4252 domain-containing protein [Chryseobacterium sp. POL2]|uniref:DUF4252 domain-containing protein n=1 Tax=Chryseobacterium sp. POL2 TaxID=2713414 RepID=UPI0013E1DA1C|nr:DUF4252 domain-containing protein [Chryseobacterium sp. POL2]QIG90377.1 DUF4252 domain-containing protein [Chryseobacterium sp. POL2]